MRLTLFTDYGLRVLMRMAGAPGRVFTTGALAEEFGISRHHLTKVIRDLAEAGYVETQRGTGGGLKLKQPAETIRLGEVVRRLERRHAMVECFRDDGGNCTLTPACRLKGKLGAAEAAFLRELDRSTLADCAYPGP